MLKFFAKLPPCLVGIEACASSHYWARELVALGHDVKLMPAQYVKPYVKRGKNDAADAEAICEAVTRPTMRFVGIKTPEQQSAMMLHRVRLILNRQRTQLSNALRVHLAEFGVVAPIGRNGIEQLLDVIADPGDERVPTDARFCLEMLAAQLRTVKEQILENDRRILDAIDGLQQVGRSAASQRSIARTPRPARCCGRGLGPCSSEWPRATRLMRSARTRARSSATGDNPSRDADACPASAGSRSAPGSVVRSWSPVPASHAPTLLRDQDRPFAVARGDVLSNVPAQSAQATFSGRFSSDQSSTGSSG